METTCRKHIEIPRDWLARFCRRNSIIGVSLFGSVVRDDFHRDSDLDVLVEFEPGAAVGYFDMMRIQREISEKMGLPVDLRTPAELSKWFRERVMEEADVRYVH